MAKLRLTLACLDYDRVKPLMLKVVEPAGIDLNILPYTPDDSVWPMVRFQEFDASEMTLATYTMLQAKGEAPYIAIPVFLARVFPHGGIFVNTKSGIEKPKDLEGKRVASGQYQMSIAVWARGILKQDYGVDLKAIDWYTARAEVGLDLPKEIKVTLFPPGKMLPDRLEDGEIDALIAPRVPPKFRDQHPHVKRLFANPREVELEYYRRTGIFPILHMIVIKESVYEQYPWVASSLYRAFVKAKEVCYQDLKETMEALKYTVPWLDSYMDNLWKEMGQDFWPYGLKVNRHVIETYIHYLYEQHLVDRKLSPEELFAPNALD
ncbi:MAG: ABC transporter substrate-binding protein [candidate division NC10 bacterium]|nr:ABC transporter substrate-binding protein [candidate division NC10 bacterium]